MESLVSTNWLQEHLHDTDLIILDCTNFAEYDKSANRYLTVSGLPQWKDEHITGAGFADFSKEMSGDTNRYRNTLPDPEKLAVAMGNLGISSQSKVVLYDTCNSMWAARVWWMLRWIGFDNAAVLDGGLSRWKSDGGSTDKLHVSRQSEILTPRIRPDIFVDRQALRIALVDASVLIVDALTQEQFSGKATRLGISGHISGAVNIPAESLVDPCTGEYFSTSTLSARFPDDKTQSTIIYCGSGIAAASTAFTMHRLGFDKVAIYMPGLQEWMVQNPSDFLIATGNKRAGKI